MFTFLRSLLQFDNRKWHQKWNHCPVLEKGRPVLCLAGLFLTSQRSAALLIFAHGDKRNAPRPRLLPHVASVVPRQQENDLVAAISGAQRGEMGEHVVAIICSRSVLSQSTTLNLRRIPGSHRPLQDQ